MITHFWTLFWILLAAGVLVTGAVLPYSLAINPISTDQMKARPGEKGKNPPPMAVIVFAGIFQGGLLIAIATYVGLLAARAVGLRLPILEALLDGRPVLPIFLAGLPVALLVGFGAGAAICALEQYYFQPRLPEAFHEVKAKQATWKRALACFYGGIYEELLLRLFVMGGLIWLIGRVFPPPAGVISLGAFWAANIISSLLFGLGHLPATARMAPLTPFIVARALILNGLAGLLFGILFLQYGLEFAMIAHFCMDIVMHLVLPELVAAGSKRDRRSIAAKAP
jgi:membrane protease YdiL (CAAX protease family)